MYMGINMTGLIIALSLVVVSSYFLSAYEAMKDKSWHDWVTLGLLYIIASGSMVYIVVS